MSFDLDPATEQRLQQELAAGPYSDPAELIAHALDLVQAERTGTLAADEAIDQAMNDWLLRNKEAINAGLEKSFSAKERDESYSPEEAEAILAERRADRVSRAA